MRGYDTIVFTGSGLMGREIDPERLLNELERVYRSRIYRCFSTSPMTTTRTTESRRSDVVPAEAMTQDDALVASIS